MKSKILSHPSKMPCPAISLDAQACKTGSKLAEIKGTVCHDCYALKGFYRMPNTRNAMKTHGFYDQFGIRTKDGPRTTPILHQWILSLVRLWRRAKRTNGNQYLGSLPTDSRDQTLDTVQRTCHLERCSRANGTA